ncbi:MAG TPA: hypothetical protein VFU43_24640 [Streptosporangiaceae bacterium]|nr:hypothetical protein [Streptosporangiaceae bacterium]
MKVLNKAGAGLSAAALIALAGACGSQQSSTVAEPSTPPSPPAATSPTAAPAPTPSTPAGRPAPPRSAPGPRRDVTISSVIAYGWQWPNETGSAKVEHRYSVPPMPTLVGIAAAGHRDLGKPPFDRVSFTFTRAFPTYEVTWVGKSEFRSDASGLVVAIRGDDVLQITFRQAQAHDGAGRVTAPRRGDVSALTLGRVLAYAGAGDFEGVVTYGLGVHRPILHSNPQTPIRVYEVHKLVNGQHRYVVAIDVDTTQ